jgi:uncharacterized protein (TIGR02145 family)
MKNVFIKLLSSLVVLLFFITCSKDGVWFDTPILYNLRILIIPENAGNTYPSSGSYEPGSSVKITATPSAGYKFKEWVGDISETSNPISVFMDYDKTITIVFEERDTDSDGISDNLDTCPDTPSGEAVDANGCSSSQLDTDDDGVIDNVDLCPNTPSGETVDATGCSSSQLDTDDDGVIDNVDLCPNTPNGETVDANGCPKTPPIEPTEVYNPTTGKIWMDRNLGATQVATSSTDTASYGDLYQWGRGTDGHQIRTSGTTSTLSSTDAPGHGNFIISPTLSDWRSPQNDNLWQGVNGVNNPCPAGFRIPTEAEWNAEIASWSSKNIAGAIASPLKLPAAGLRYIDFDPLNNISFLGRYWSSAVDGTYSRYQEFNFNNAFMFNSIRAKGLSVRCIKD